LKPNIRRENAAMDKKQSCRVDLVEALLKCPTLAKPAGRDQCLTLLDDPIPTKVDRDSDARDDITNIVQVCVVHAGGIDGLVKAVDAREKGSLYMPEVRRCAAALKDAMDRSDNGRSESARLGVGDVSADDSNIGYALVIGISEYEQAAERDPHRRRRRASATPHKKQQTVHRFPTLNYAAADAEEFHKVLQEHNYKGPKPLLNERATLRAIMHALDDLVRQCRTSANPLVLLFFSGHGARDDAGRDYLVPHDGVRNDLFATALWSETLKSALRPLQSNQLVLFLDACHAAAFDNEVVKGDFKTCNPAELMEGEGNRFVVASCGADKVAREGEGHGVFSGHLLQLLRFEREEDQEREVIELFDLSQTVKERVIEETSKKSDGTTQEPYTNVKEDTGIVLAINRARRKIRQESERELLDCVYPSLKKAVGGPEMRAFLLQFIYHGEVDKRREEFCDYFRDVARRLKGPPPSDEIEKICRTLKEFWTGGDFGGYHKRDAFGVPVRATLTEGNPATSSVAAMPSPPSNRSLSRDDVVARGRPPLNAGTARVGVPIFIPSTERRCLPSADVSFLLENIRAKATKAKYSGRIALLKGLMSRSDGMSEKEFKALQSATCKDADPFWAGLVDDIGARFELRWRNAFKPGAWACSPCELADLAVLAGKLTQPERTVDAWLADKLPVEAREALVEYQGSGSDALLEEALLLCLNTIIHGPSIWDEQRFEGIQLRSETARVRSQNPQGDVLQRLNRMLLEDAYPDGLARKESPQDALSVRMRGPHA
jgi:caspase domain-containing protein/effector-associated domain 2 (EAD2)-containing protein